MLIPKIIHQVWDGPMQPGIQECLDSVKRVMPDYDVVVHGGADMDELVPEPLCLVERTNLYRYRLLHRHGGWWADADCYALRPLDSDKPHSFGEQEKSAKVVDWAFGTEAGNPDMENVLARISPTIKQRRSSLGLDTDMPSLGVHMAKALSGRKLEPFHVYGSRRFSYRSPSKLIPKNANLVHLFLGSWYNNRWRGGVRGKVMEVERWK